MPPLMPVRTLVLLLAGALAAVAVAALTYLVGHSMPASLLAAGPAGLGTVIGLHQIIGGHPHGPEDAPEGEGRPRSPVRPPDGR